ncbi:TIGR03986 family type III CRISPR-associated RAMP protein [Metallibacterium scheffleri]|uniref:CRISPR-associated RAMP family protein n=2 Tax=Metallibacterium scheffleri TaxID=993689 RepID=A0A4S3KP18_9GAMM|nr:CRISPR-associated RAMP family protein [Metallibacterium scheffleri]
MSNPNAHSSNAQGPSRHQNGSRSQGQDNSAREMISAPYNFVPLAPRVHIPAWSREVSHDWPFEDGYSGELHYILTADTPLLVGGKQIKATQDKPGSVKPLQWPDGTYAIPGSSLKGMLRSVVEIAAFGRMRMVDEVRPGLRDISKSDTVYATRVRDRVKTGFLCRRKDGGQEIVPCKMLRLDHRALEKALGVKEPIFATRTSVKDKYETWSQACRKAGKNPRSLRFDLGADAKAPIRLFEGALEGVPVFTGQINDSTQPRGKRRDFVFYARDASHAIEVSRDAWRDFLRIHGDEDGKPAMSWPGYWKNKYRAGEDVPVFYLRDTVKNKDLLRIGLAYMPKLAGDFSSLDMIEHVSCEHLQPPGAQHGYDLADLLFGAINGDSQADALRGRVSLETAHALDNPQAVAQPATILNGPKPSYFPNYITQQANPSNWKLKTSQYATYLESSQSKAPTLRGFKRYPVRPLSDAQVQSLTDEQLKNRKVQIELHTLAPESRFAGRIVFHNLKPEELGALLWALTWGGKTHLRHSLGMGKPFGFGQVHFTLDTDQSRLIPNDPAIPEAALDAARRADFVAAFAAHMEASFPQWEQSPQLLNLCAMADPAAACKLPVGMPLRHMRLEAKGKVNEFQTAKQGNSVLADYAVASGYIPATHYQPTQGKPHGAVTVSVDNKAVPAGATAPTAYATTLNTWPNAKLKWEPGPCRLTATLAGKGKPAVREQATRLLDALPEPQRERLRKKGELAGVEVEVEAQGNRLTIVGLIWPAG